MAKYFFDTDTLNSLVRKDSQHHKKVINKILSLKGEDELFTSILSLYEMEYGVQHSKEEYKALAKKAVHAVIDNPNLTVLPLTERGAEIFGELKQAYQQNLTLGKKAIQKYNIDFMIASIAIEIEGILVSGDGVFKDIQDFRTDFRYENWHE
jgi:predicted nucleic acid-binding protein